jgi:intracellular septation protein
MLRALIEFMPLAAFLVAYSLGGIYAATAALMIAMPVMVLLLWLVTRKVGAMPLISTVLVLGFGTLTLLLHDPRFIQWKATIYLWGVAVVLTVNCFVGRQLLVRQFLGAIAEGRRVSRAQWRGLNYWWIAVYLALGAANLLFAYYTPEAVWARFKVWGITGALLVFIVGQTYWLQRLPSDEEAAQP